MITKYIETALAKHDITAKDIDFVLRTDITIWCDLGPSKRGNDRLMFIGFSSNGRLLEVGVEYMGDDVELVLHADCATFKHRKLFRETYK